MKSQVLRTVWCYTSGEGAGEIWSWSILVDCRSVYPEHPSCTTSCNNQHVCTFSSILFFLQEPRYAFLHQSCSYEKSKETAWCWQNANCKLLYVVSMLPIMKDCLSVPCIVRRSTSSGNVCILRYCSENLLVVSWLVWCCFGTCGTGGRMYVIWANAHAGVALNGQQNPRLPYEKVGDAHPECLFQLLRSTEKGVALVFFQPLWGTVPNRVACWIGSACLELKNTPV